MAKNWKTKTIKVTRGWANWLLLFLVLFAMLFLLRFDAVASKVSEVTGIDQTKLQNYATDLSVVAIGIIILMVATKFMFYPPAGLLMAGVGLLIVAYGGWNLYQSNSSASG